MPLYRLLTGKFHGEGPEGCDCPNCTQNKMEMAKKEKLAKQGEKYSPRTKDHAYLPGDIVDTELDLLSFNMGPQFMRFELVDPEGRVVRQEKKKPGRPKKEEPKKKEVEIENSPLAGMDLEDMKMFAVDEGIRLPSDLTTEEEISDYILENLKNETAI